MPRYEVKVRFEIERVLHSVYARDEEGAEQRATEIVEGWDNVKAVEVLEVEEV